VLKLAHAHFNGVVPGGGELSDTETVYQEQLSTLIDAYASHCDQMNVRKAVAALREIWVLGNNYVNDAAPWRAIKVDRTRAAMIVRFMLNLLRVEAMLAGPIIPSTSATILRSLHRHADENQWPKKRIDLELSTITPGDRFEVPANLFEKIPDSRVQSLSERYGGAYRAG
jgi:methionyl-tRNA synthetase